MFAIERGERERERERRGKETNLQWWLMEEDYKFYKPQFRKALLRASLHIVNQ